MHEGLIVAADRVEALVAWTEGDTDDVFGVSPVGTRSSADARVVEDVDETVVITSGEEHLVTGSANGVDVCTIGAGGIDALSLPKELAGCCSPLGTHSI